MEKQYPIVTKPENIPADSPSCRQLRPVSPVAKWQVDGSLVVAHTPPHAGRAISTDLTKRSFLRPTQAQVDFRTWL